MKLTKYDVVPLMKDNEYVWTVYELATEQVIDAFYFEEDAVAFAKSLDRGRGFAGWTPGFMLQKVVVSKDINLEFSELVLSE